MKRLLDQLQHQHQYQLQFHTVEYNSFKISLNFLTMLIFQYFSIFVIFNNSFHSIEAAQEKKCTNEKKFRVKVRKRILIIKVNFLYSVLKNMISYNTVVMRVDRCGCCCDDKVMYVCKEVRM